MTTITDYREAFETDTNDVITSPGKFEGEHLSIAYFWECAMEGDTITAWDGTTPIFFFPITTSDLELFPDLKDRYGLALYETESGFVNSVWFESLTEYNEALDNPNEVI